VRCDSSDGNAWLILHIEALRRGEVALARRALRRMVGGGFLSPAALGYARWALTALPARAVFITVGDLDTYPAFAVQGVDAVRGDVAVVSMSLLNLPWYARRVRDSLQVPLFLSDAALDTLWEKGYPGLADTIVRLWRRADMDGTLGRPLAFAATAGDAFVRDAGPGRYWRAGPYWLLARGADTTQADTVRLGAALAAASGASFAGPPTGVGERSPVRLGATPFGYYPLYLWTVYVDLLVGGGRMAEARKATADMRAFAATAGLDDAYVRSLLEQATRRAGTAP